MLFQGIDVEGEKRRQMMRVKAEEEAKERTEMAIQRGQTTGSALVENLKEGNDAKERTKVKRLKWWQKVDDLGNLKLEKGAKEAAMEAKAKQEEKGNEKALQYVRPKQNHRAFHSVLVLTRQNKSHFRNLRQQTHVLKRVVLSELTRKVYNDKRGWFVRWQTQERMLAEAMESFVKEAKRRVTEVQNMALVAKKKTAERTKTTTELKDERRQTR